MAALIAYTPIWFRVANDDASLALELSRPHRSYVHTYPVGIRNAEQGARIPLTERITFSWTCKIVGCLHASIPSLSNRIPDTLVTKFLFIYHIVFILFLFTSGLFSTRFVFMASPYCCQRSLFNMGYLLTHIVLLSILCV